MPSLHTQAQREQVVEAPVTKHQCLRDQVSFNGLYGWQPEVQAWQLQSKGETPWTTRAKCKLKRKSAADRTPAKNLKTKSEVNDLPSHPQGETDATIEKERVELLYE